MFKKKKPYESRTRADKYLIFKNLVILLGFIILLALMVINGIIFFVNAPVNETILPVDTNNLFVWTFIFLLIYSFLITFLFLINLFKLNRERKYLGCMVDSIVDFAESKDNFTAEHHRKVAQIAKGIAKKMNLSGERIKIIYKAGLIHDIGKINIPERTLNKSTKLIDSELEIIKTHPVIGYNILCNITIVP